MSAVIFDVNFPNTQTCAAFLAWQLLFQQGYARRCWVCISQNLMLSTFCFILGPKIHKFAHSFVWWYRNTLHSVSFCDLLHTDRHIAALNDKSQSYRPSDLLSHALNRQKEFWKCVMCVHNLMKTKFFFHCELFTSRRSLTATFADFQQGARVDSTFGENGTVYDKREVEQSIDISTWKGILAFFYWHMQKVNFNCISKSLYINHVHILSETIKWNTRCCCLLKMKSSFHIMKKP